MNSSTSTVNSEVSVLTGKTNPFKALWHAFDNNYYLVGCILGIASMFIPLIFGKEVIPTLAIVADVIAVASLVIGVINFALRGSK